MLPEPPRASFASDNAAGAHPAVLDALRAANEGHELAYGDDPWTMRAESRMDELFGRPVRTLLCWGGTGANVVGLQCLLGPAQAVICAATAHIAVDECGAPERFTGAKLIDVPTSDGKLRPVDVEPHLATLGVVHHVQPRVVSITQSSELGTVYTPDEVAALVEQAHRHGLVVHMDGARIANAVAASGGRIRDLRACTVDAGVDVLTFGGTKNGLLYGEAVVFLRPELGETAPFVRKQAGQLASKMRFVAAQFLAMLAEDRWIATAAHANRMAALLADRLDAIDGVELVRPPEVNAVFVRLPPAAVAPLQAWSFVWPWDAARHEVRVMTSFDTDEADVERFAEGVAAIVTAT